MNRRYSQFTWCLIRGVSRQKLKIKQTKHYGKALQLHRAHSVCSLRLRSLSALHYAHLVIQQQLLVQMDDLVVSAII